MQTTSGGARRGASHFAAAPGRARRAAWYDLGLAAAIPLGEGRVFNVAGTPVAVYRTRAGELFASQARCPHRGGPLADGLVGAGAVVCPLHALRFDLATGAPLGGQPGGGPSCAALTTYPVQLALDGTIRVCLSAYPPADAPVDAAADADAA